MQENSVQSKTKFKVILVAILILLFSITITIVSIVQIVQINKLNNKIDQQERMIEDLNSQYDDLVNG